MWLLSFVNSLITFKDRYMLSKVVLASFLEDGEIVVLPFFGLAPSFKYWMKSVKNNVNYMLHAELSNVYCQNQEMYRSSRCSNDNWQQFCNYWRCPMLLYGDICCYMVLLMFIWISNGLGWIIPSFDRCIIVFWLCIQAPSEFTENVVH